MAKKALFHKTIITTGHGSKIYTFPAQRQIDVINALQTNSKKVNVGSSEWLSVQIMSGPDGVYFMADGNLVFYEGDYGFGYLVNQFNPEYQKEVDSLFN